MQMQYTLNLVDSEALEARWYCSILNFQLYLAVILLFHLFWEFFEGKTMTKETMHREGRRKMREGCCNGERLQRRQQHHHQQASFSPIRRWPISQRHVKSASQPAESGGL
uniref:Uncharacterized protein n=1 Tax=Populus davidiana TaxID=266767 RepID=A0A6M2F4H0_9ROSI